MSLSTRVLNTPVNTYLPQSTSPWTNAVTPIWQAYTQDLSSHRGHPLVPFQYHPLSGSLTRVHKQLGQNCTAGAPGLFLHLSLCR